MCVVTDEDEDDASSGEEDTAAEDVGISALNKKQTQLATYEEPDDEEREIIQQDVENGGWSFVLLHVMRGRLLCGVIRSHSWIAMCLNSLWECQTL